MPIQGWEQLVDPTPSVTDGTALTASTTATTITPAASRVGLYANFFRIGKRIRVYASGRVTNIATTPGTLTLEMRIGPSSPPTLLAMSSGAMVLGTNAKTNVNWMLEWDATCRAVGTGTSANLFHTGRWTTESAAGNTATASETRTNMLQAATPAVGAGFDSTVSTFFDLYATWSLNNANSITCHQFHIEELN